MKINIEIPDPPRKVLPFGTRVVCTKVDKYGYTGREEHPLPSDVGFTGVVIENFVELSVPEVLDNVKPFTVLGEDETVLYTVLSPLGRRVMFVEHEIEVL